MINTISKKITLFLGLVGLLMSPTPLQCTSDIQKLKMLCATHNQVLESGLLSIMHELETSLAYWHTMEDTPFSYAVIRGPKGWIGSKTAREAILNNIEILSKKQEDIANALGTLVKYQATVESLNDSKALETRIAQCFTLSATLLGKPQIVLPQAAEGDLIDYGTSAIKQLSIFHEQYLSLINVHLKPNHLMRNWTKYTLGAACLIATAALAYKHQDALARLKEKTITGLQHIWTNHIQIPIQNTRDILFGRKHYNIVTAEAIEGDKEVVRDRLRLYLPKIFPNKSKEQISEQIEYIIRSKDTRDIMKDWSDQLANPGKKFAWHLTPYFGEEARLFETTVLNYDMIKLQVNEATMAAQQAWEAQQLNAELLAIFPVALSLYGLKKGWDKLFHGKILSEPLQHRLMLADKLLNAYNTGDKYLDNAGFGYLHYHTHALTQYVGRIPSGQQKAFIADIAELNNPAFTVEQKLRVIDQMYRQYAFLNPLAV